MRIIHTFSSQEQEIDMNYLCAINVIISLLGKVFIMESTCAQLW